MTATLLRRHFPVASICPLCACGEFITHSTKNGISYRTCGNCAHRYKILPNGFEIPDGKGGSKIVPSLEEV